MNKLKFLALILVACLFVEQAIAKTGIYRKLERQEEISVISNIRNILLNTQEKVTACLKNGSNNATCYCRFKKNYVYLDRLTKKMFETYPDWEFDKELRYVEQDKLKFISPNELVRQIDFKFRCAYTKF
ncbi:MAG: hypothetical protein HRU29_04135 [Rhizobiales bacterium]|nr:hypothetical protein [Hyphomicrobiales bacterium]NRB13570.1 hypothetical protein [Hyphomicrobiales bacterium]